MSKCPIGFRKDLLYTCDYLIFLNELCVYSDYPGAPGPVQGAGSRDDEDGALPGGSHPGTVPRLLQKVQSPLFKMENHQIMFPFFSGSNRIVPVPVFCITALNVFALMQRCVVRGRYSPNELRYLPLNTALFEPPLDPELPALDSEPDSDDPEDGKGDKKIKNSSVRHSAVYKYSSGPQVHVGLVVQMPDGRCLQLHDSPRRIVSTTSLSSPLSFTLSPSFSVSLQNSSSGNTSDVESQEGAGKPGPKSKAKDKTSTPGKDSSQPHSASHKAIPGYKVEDKST